MKPIYVTLSASNLAKLVQLKYQLLPIKNTDNNIVYECPTSMLTRITRLLDTLGIGNEQCTDTSRRSYHNNTYFISHAAKPNALSMASYSLTDRSEQVNLMLSLLTKTKIKHNVSYASCYKSKVIYLRYYSRRRMKHCV
jgi:hypothetical protein